MEEFCVGLSYEWGKDFPKNTIEAAKWYERSAVHGYPAAGVNLGKLYESGDGVTQSYRLAVKWFRVSAELGNPWGQALLGDSLLEGSINGQEENPVEAAKWLHKSLEGGYWLSGEYLGWQYINGNGVPKDLVAGHALILFTEASSSTLLYRSTAASKQSAKKLTTDQITQAEALSRRMRSAGTNEALKSYFSHHVHEYCHRSLSGGKVEKQYYAFSDLCGG